MPTVKNNEKKNVFKYIKKLRTLVSRQVCKVAKKCLISGLTPVLLRRKNVDSPNQKYSILVQLGYLPGHPFGYFFLHV